VHLLDAVEDHAADEAAGRFNPLRATGTPPDGARRLADELVAEVSAALAEAVLVDRALVDVLLGRELRSAVHRVLPEPAPEPAAVTVPAQRSGLLALLLAVLLSPAVFIGGSWGGGGWGPRRRRRYGGPRPMYGYPPPGPSYGYRRVGPSCGQLLACNCCANLACNACCCGNSCANG